MRRWDDIEENQNFLMLRNPPKMGATRSSNYEFELIDSVVDIAQTSLQN